LLRFKPGGVTPVAGEILSPQTGPIDRGLRDRVLTQPRPGLLFWCGLADYFPVPGIDRWPFTEFTSREGRPADRLLDQSHRREHLTLGVFRAGEFCRSSNASIHPASCSQRHFPQARRSFQETKGSPEDGARIDPRPTPAMLEALGVGDDAAKANRVFRPDPAGAVTPWAGECVTPEGLFPFSLGFSRPPWAPLKVPTGSDWWL